MYDRSEEKSTIPRTDLVYGSENVVDSLVQFMHRAKLRIDVCVDHTRPGLVIEIRRLMDAFNDAKKRQVKIRYITEFTKDNLDYCKELISIFDEFRHLDGIKGNFYVSESEYDAPSTLHEKGKSSEMMIYSNVKEIVEHQQYIFDTFWSKAVPAEQRIKEIEEGIEPEYFEVFTYQDRERVSQILFDISKSVKKEALILLPSVKALIRVDRLGVIDHVINASQRGATVKIICPLSEENSKVTRKIDEQASAVKVINGNNTPYGMYIMDGEKFLKAEVKEPDAETFSEAIGFCAYSNSKLSVDSFRSIFELLWNQHTINEELKRADKMQKQFINVAAHELRTPIQPILGMLGLLRSKIDIRKDELDESLDLMIRNAIRLKQLSEDILDVTKIEGQSLNLRKEVCDLIEIVRNSIEEYKRNEVKRSKKNIEIIYTSYYAEVFVDIDRSRIAQVICNLLSNAFKFTKEGSIIVNVELDQRNTRAIVSVKDSGKGIDLEVVPRLFEKFASKSFQGTGLGLFISRSILEGHGGRIWAVNNEKVIEGQRGATFYFTLPIVKRDRTDT